MYTMYTYDNHKVLILLLNLRQNCFLKQSLISPFEIEAFT